jgi:hypothetical protein
LRRWPDLADSLWRSPVLVERIHGRLRRLVAAIAQHEDQIPDLIRNLKETDGTRPPL